MALPTPSPTGFQQIPNRDFELGAVGWTTDGTASIVNESPLGGSWSVKTAAAGEFNDGGVLHDDFFPVIPGQVINVTAIGKMTTGTPGTSFSCGVLWYDSAFSLISDSGGAQVTRAAVGSAQATCSGGGAAPAGAAYAKPRGWMNTSASATVSTIYMDNFSWNYSFGVGVELTSPLSSYTQDVDIPYRISIQGLPSGVTVTSVDYYYMTWDGADYVGATLVSSQTEAPYAFNAPPMAEGQYGAYAEVTLSNGTTLTTNSRVFVVGEGAPTDTREFKASNSYTYLVGENFNGLKSAIPSTALVIGAEVVIDYTLEVLVRSSDLEITDPTSATSAVAFAVVKSGMVEAALLRKSGSGYNILGAPMSNSITISEVNFDITEEGTSDDKKWTVYTMDGVSTVTVGGENILFGQTSIDAPTFTDSAVGVRFFPILSALPDYADTGEACYRFKIDSYKLRVYFDAGSVEYYFAGPGYGDVIKGTLAAYNVSEGGLTTADASGIMQLTPDLEVVSGGSDVIQGGWTIHSAYPPTDLNRIGYVAQTMEYNGLPTYEQVESNRSRYVFITANFYGDKDLNAIYGANGVDRAFSYNRDFFYKIWTQAEVEKDKPRHVAFHHSHLALGFDDGRVDLSVVGEPFNFDGVDGANSWAIGDSVVGLLPLSGTILGIFCKKSIWGLSGTTVDNFATQVVSPNIGAVEYTITDMGFPVYANAYGIYTLSQTEKYSDYLGAPMSQPVSPWLRPRLIRKATSDKEVVVAWPVRSKNQYKLAFADGNVLTMTMNYGSQQAPTFSKQKYFLQEEGEEISLEATSIVPAAISSELDEGGEERIHIANKQLVEAPPVGPVLFFEYTSMSGGG